MKNHLFLAGLILLLGVSCNKSTEPPKEVTPFVQQYIEAPDEVEVSVSKLSSVDDPIPAEFSLYLYEPIMIGIPISRPLTSADKLDSIARANQDTHCPAFREPYVREVMHRRTIEIQVISNTAYDSQHPAGTSLDDLFDIQFLSPEDFIYNGYKDNGTYLGKTTTQAPYSDMDRSLMPTKLIESLREFNQIQRRLLVFGFTLTVKTPPAVTSTHLFTITYHNEDGISLVAKTEPITILGGGE